MECDLWNVLYGMQYACIRCSRFGDLSTVPLELVMGMCITCASVLTALNLRVDLHHEMGFKVQLKLSNDPRSTNQLSLLQSLHDSDLT